MLYPRRNYILYTLPKWYYMALGPNSLTGRDHLFTRKKVLPLHLSEYPQPNRTLDTFGVNYLLHVRLSYQNQIQIQIAKSLLKTLQVWDSGRTAYRICATRMAGEFSILNV